MRTFAYKSFLVVCSFALVAGVIAMLLDWEPAEPQMIDPSDLTKIQIGDIVRLSELLKSPAEKVCFLTPYQNRLAETEPLSRLVNAHLKAIDLYLDDNGFALVFVNRDKVRAQRIGKKPNPVSTWHPWNQGVSRIFKPLGCATVERALVTRSPSGHLLFGEQR